MLPALRRSRATDSLARSGPPSRCHWLCVVTDALGNPIPGFTVDWTVTGGGSVSTASTPTDASGQASVTRTLGPAAGAQTAVATATGLAGSPVTFTHTATAGTATGVIKVSGDNQSGSPSTELALPLVVQVLDGAGNPIPNRPLTWTIGEGGGGVSEVNTTTDAQGNASTRWTLGPGVGRNTVNAVVSGVGTGHLHCDRYRRHSERVELDRSRLRRARSAPGGYRAPSPSRSGMPVTIRWRASR